MQILNISVMNRPARWLTSKLFKPELRSSVECSYTMLDVQMIMPYTKDMKPVVQASFSMEDVELKVSPVFKTNPVVNCTYSMLDVVKVDLLTISTYPTVEATIDFLPVIQHVWIYQNIESHVKTEFTMLDVIRG